MLQEGLVKSLSTVSVIVFFAAGLAACSGENQSETCWARADKENKMLAGLIHSAFKNHRVVLSIEESNGCDSANNGAWLDVTLNANVTKNEVRNAFTKAGWSSNVDKFMPCGPTCNPTMAIQSGKRRIGMNLSKEADTPWMISMQAIDDCWTDDSYTC
ncbi:hypothetical protein ABT352_25915 [Streptosporangium sp. NPDC000563]|uniref:hypothetical protein n=1 Tax=unclassified Streptosporangium TaxID=2632669 RepID=UPI0033340FD6